MEKVAIFIDGGYLNSILKMLVIKNLDYKKLCDNICERIAKISPVVRLRTYYYDCLPLICDNKDRDKKRLADKQRFLQRLKRLPRFAVKLGKLQKIGDSFKQKRVDVLMSLDIVDMAFDKTVDHIVVIAGDSDFLPAIETAKDYGAIVHLYYHPQSIHNEVLDVIDELNELGKELFDKSQIGY